MTDAVDVAEILVQRDSIAQAELGQRRVSCGDGEALFHIEHFALTANNATYAVHGDDLHYWRFFPASRDGRGIVPVWGFAKCTVSKAEGVVPGERYYGFWPMASHAVLRPARGGARGFDDIAEHRAALPAVYNGYQRASADDPVAGDERIYALIRPLYATAFLLADQLAEIDGLGAVVISSASSKTALALAQQLRAAGLRTVGLTSPANLAFVEAAGAYDGVQPYGALLVPPAERTAFADIAGDPGVRMQVHTALGNALAASLGVGDTHWDAPRAAEHPPGPRSEFFFAPHRLAKRVADWGAAGLWSRLDAAWPPLAAAFARWLTIEEVRGGPELIAAWRETVEGRADPRRGVIASLTG